MPRVPANDPFLVADLESEVGADADVLHTAV